MAAVSLIFLIGLVAVLSLAFVLSDRRAIRLGIAAATLVGYIGGGALMWRLVPSNWRLPFWETLAASVDAEKYGHPVEHYAESVTVMILAGCVAAALVCGVTAAAVGRLRKPQAC